MNAPDLNIGERIEVALVKIRKYLEEDNGGIEFVRYEEPTRVAELRFTGSCKVCPLQQMTLRGGIERFLLMEVPEIRRVEAVL